MERWSDGVMDNFALEHAFAHYSSSPVLQYSDFTGQLHL
jgi:hypothetical protein